MSGYAARSTAIWRASSLIPFRCFALVEIVNLPSRFVCSNPFYVVDNTDWIVWYVLVTNNAIYRSLIFCSRYLLIESGNHQEFIDGNNYLEPGSVNFLAQDPLRTAILNNVPVQVPKPSHHVEKLLKACQEAWSPVQYTGEDMTIFGAADELQEIDVPDSIMTPRGPSVEKWASDNNWVGKNVECLLPPPTESSTTASMALQRELRTMYRDQRKARKNEMELLGWYMPQDFNEDNLYQWVVEMHSFDPELPLAKDMKGKYVLPLTFHVWLKLTLEPLQRGEFIGV